MTRAHLRANWSGIPSLNQPWLVALLHAAIAATPPPPPMVVVVVMVVVSTISHLPAGRSAHRHSD